MPPEYFFPLAGMMFALGWGVIGTVRWYLKERLYSRRQEAVGGGAGDPERVGLLEARVAELEERVDFAERLLARERDRPPLGEHHG